MGKRYERYTPEFKQRVVREYRAGDRGAGYQALAKKWQVGGGARLVARWVQQWDGTTRSLSKRTRPNHPRLLSRQQAQTHIRDVVARRHTHHQPVSYIELAADVREATGVGVSVRTVRRYGREDFGQRHRRVTIKPPREGTTCS